ncbi:MAG: hypothetical protein WA771_12845 [Chthoniobacterales bacterium]
MFYAVGNESAEIRADVYRLCKRLGRPVSSKDLLRHYRSRPDSRPLVMQRLGQVLFKLSRRPGRTDMPLARIGVIGNLAFYAPQNSKIWRSAFRAHEIFYGISEQCLFRMPEHASRLLGTRFDSLAQNALAGFVQEWQEPFERHLPPDPTIENDFRSLLGMAAKNAVIAFIPVRPRSMVCRAEADAILREEYGIRMPMTSADAMSTGRHLVHLAWPQSSLFLRADCEYWEDQVRTYCASRWPVNNAERNFGKALSLAMRYGAGGMD